MEESQAPVTKEMWYGAQRAMSETIKALAVSIEKISMQLDVNTRETIKNGEHDNDMAKDITEIKVQTQKTNGRVSSLESSRLQIWTAISILLLLGGVIITLSIMAIDTKIAQGIDQAFNDRFESIEVIQ